MPMRFTGKTAIVTGAGQGLGAQYAKDLTAEGASVVLVGRTESKLKRVEEEIFDRGGKAIAVPCDVSSEDDVKNMVNAAVTTFETVDILINNAAFHRAILVEDTPKELWDQQININLTGTFLCCKAVIPIMKDNRYGKIVNIASSAAKHYFPGFGAYAASKAGIVSLTQTLDVELKDYGININAVYLGMTNTEYTRARKKEGVNFIPLEEMLQVDEVSRVVLFLVSDAAAPIMGTAVDVFGKKA
jgi:NAD(P)-dependent dehydrogenase (short-subunit alcohol dehydrogenase family)